jgi:hypothetical protein
MNVNKLLGIFVLNLIMGLLFLSPLLAQESKKIYLFNVKQTDTISSSSARLGGEYEVEVSGGKARVFELYDSQRVEAATGPGLDLVRMVGIDAGRRKLLNPPHTVGKQWEATYEYRIPGIQRQLSKTVTYKVTGEETITTLVGQLPVIRIEGDAYVNGTEQKFIYYYSEQLGVIVKYLYDSNVKSNQAKMYIDLKKVVE